MSHEHLKENDFFRTSDFPLIATLCLYLPIESIDRKDSQRFHFIFRRGERLEEILEKYYRKELQVEPEAFYYAIKGAKARIHGQG